MPNESIPSRDSEYSSWLANFATVAAAHAGALQLTPAQASDLAQLAADFAQALEEIQAARAAFKGKAANKRNAREASAELFRSIGRQIQANPDIDDALKADLGLQVARKPTSPLAPASHLAATVVSGTQARLVWDRNGNSDRTTFLIEAKIGDSSTWTLLAATTRTRYIHTFQTPGQQIVYRVVSQRGQTQSSPSNSAVVFPAIHPDAPQLPMAA